MSDRPEFFDKTLVAYTERALASDSFEGFRDSIQTAANNEMRSVIRKSGGSNFEWLVQNPKAWRVFSEESARFESALNTYNQNVKRYNNRVNPSRTDSILDRLRGGAFDIEDYQRLQDSHQNDQLANSIDEQLAWLEAEKPRIEQQQKSLQEQQEQLEKYLFPVVSGTITWRLPPADFEVWSGVRESNFECTLENLTQPSGDELPFRFMLQTAFTSPAFFDASGELIEDEEDDRNEDDIPPWTFEAISDELHQSVVTSVTEEERLLISRMSEFTQLQRIFRLFFESNHPQLHRLVELNSELNQAVPVKLVRTSRWNARPGALEIILQIQLLEFGPKLENTEAKSQLDELSELVTEQLNAVATLRELQAADESDWSEGWDRYLRAIEAGRKKLPDIVSSLGSISRAQQENKVLEQLHQTANQYSLAVQLRSELGVIEDDRAVLKRSLDRGSE
ncbi:MAG: hypothetical protein R3C18_14055 [Planctomycetaceae bacterium]